MCIYECIHVNVCISFYSIRKYRQKKSWVKDSLGLFTYFVPLSSCGLPPELWQGLGLRVYLLSGITCLFIRNPEKEP